MTTPKQRFQQSGHSAAFGKLVASEAFDPACDYALLELLSEMPANRQPGAATDGLVGFDTSAQMQGAIRVLDILKRISEPEKNNPVRRETLHY
jgi:hypothetical protein